MLLLIDNYDSFTYNLAQYFGELGEPPTVVRNDKITIEQARRMKPDFLVISPGPGNPTQAGMSGKLIRHFAGKIPILGVCLGHQCLGYELGGKVVRAKRLMHGKVSKIYHDQEGIFDGIENPFEATRYHSLIVLENALPAELRVTAHTSEGEIMGLQLRGQPVFGVQFHPESVLTPVGKQILRNFLSYGSTRKGARR